MRLGSPVFMFATSGILHPPTQPVRPSLSPRFPWVLAQRPFLVPTELVATFKQAMVGIYGASFCTTVAEGGPCTSNCDAKAQCGPNAPAGAELCLLNVCCSQHGFGGTTETFCGTGYRVGYDEGWASSRSCDAWTYSSMNVDSLTHLNFAFVYISSTFEVIEMTPGDSALWTETTALQSRNPALKVFLSIGGWTYQRSSHSQYGFDGIDIDWEYPVAEDRGSPGDFANYPTFLKAIKKAFTPFGYGLSFTAPSCLQDWYLQNLPSLLADGAADWVNVMTYDLHVCVWDSPADYIGSIILGDADVGVNPSQIVMGIGFYGRSFELSSVAWTDPGCPFAGAAPAGACSGNPGTFMFTEIEDLIASVGSDQLIFDEAAAVNIDWVSYDDQQTLRMKLQYANGICLGGTMDDNSFTALSDLWGDVTANNASSSITGEILMGLSQVRNANSSINHDGITSPELSCLLGEVVRTLFCLSVDVLAHFVIWRALCCETNEGAGDSYCAATDCDATKCSNGFSAYTTGLVLGVEELELCTGRTLYCQDDIGLTNCKWHGAIPNRLNSACPVGQMSITADPQGDATSSCLGGKIRTYCCDTPDASTFSPVPVNDVFPLSETTDDAVAFAVDYDDNERTSSDKSIGDGSRGLSDDGKENDSPFSSVFISSPNAASVSSLDHESDWAITDCDATSDQQQSVTAYCTCPMDDEDCGCAHVFIGQAADTVVKLPTTCGLGPYALVVSLESCPNFQSSLDTSVSRFASVNSQFRHYLEAIIVPPAAQQAYVYFQAGAGAEGKHHQWLPFIITGIASTSWDSGCYELVNFGFPGLYYPGLLTLGPSLHLYGELSEALSLSGTYKTSVSNTFPNLDLNFGKQDSGAGQSNIGNAVVPTNNYGAFDYSVGWNVELSSTADVCISI
ncbi:hypothetical protein K438DRAFT_1992598 [Mycena galopus ATCC 62051]|nr:hypothetical protein K438DRAFT_1992598 [Mycena galopus ATCC 62051]